MMAPVRESGTAIAAAGGALWAAATCGPPPPLLPGIEVAAEFGGDRLAVVAALGGERIPFGIAGFESAAPLPVELVPVEDEEDEEGEDDIGAWSGRG